MKTTWREKLSFSAKNLGVPHNSILAWWERRQIRSPSYSASSISWVATTITRPYLRALMSYHMVRFSAMFMPSVGESRRITLAPLIRVKASDSFFRLTGERILATMLAVSSNSKSMRVCLTNSSMFGMPRNLHTNSMFSAGVKVPSKVTSCSE